MHARAGEGGNSADVQANSSYVLLLFLNVLTWSLLGLSVLVALINGRSPFEAYSARASAPATPVRLHEAAVLSPEVLQWSIDHFADVDELDGHGRTALWYAAAHQLPQNVTLLLQRGADPNCPGQSQSPLVAALSPTNAPNSPFVAAIVGALLENGADPGVQEHVSYRTPLHHAALLDSADSARRLLATGTEVDAIDRDGRSPLSIAAESRSFQTIELLLKHGASPDLPDRNGLTPRSRWTGDARVEALVTDIEAVSRSPGITP